MIMESYDEMVTRLFKKRHEGEDGFMHAAAGIAGEGGEVLDLIKKVWVYGKPLDREKLIEELGDLLFYWTAMAHLLRVSVSEIKHANTCKLLARYPYGYTDEAAINRVDVKR